VLVDAKYEDISTSPTAGETIVRSIYIRQKRCWSFAYNKATYPTTILRETLF
jgi:hypothetical protein